MTQEEKIREKTKQRMPVVGFLFSFSLYRATSREIYRYRLRHYLSGIRVGAAAAAVRARPRPGRVVAEAAAGSLPEAAVG